MSASSLIEYSAADATTSKTAASPARPATTRTRRCGAIRPFTTPSVSTAIRRLRESAKSESGIAPNAICRNTNCPARISNSPIIESGSSKPAKLILIEHRNQNGRANYLRIDHVLRVFEIMIFLPPQRLLNLAAAGESNLKIPDSILGESNV